ncbi:hypothetical protein P8971_23535 [Serratia marcescens]|uniref:hypothetical protein n=1 Tax=Serratia marcescens TaxID=615 RepID=UPI003204EEDB
MQLFIKRQKTGQKPFACPMKETSRKGCSVDATAYFTRYKPAKKYRKITDCVKILAPIFSSVNNIAPFTNTAAILIDIMRKGYKENEGVYETTYKGDCHQRIRGPALRLLSTPVDTVYCQFFNGSGSGDP